MKEKFTLWKLLNSNERKNLDLSKKLKICSIDSPSLIDRLTADIDEYFIDDVPFRLLKQEVFTVYYYENAIVVCKNEVKENVWKYYFARIIVWNIR